MVKANLKIKLFPSVEDILLKNGIIIYNCTMYISIVLKLRIDDDVKRKFNNRDYLHILR